MVKDGFSNLMTIQKTRDDCFREAMATQDDVPICMASYLDLNFSKGYSDNLGNKTEKLQDLALEASRDLFLLLEARDMFSMTYSMYLGFRLREGQTTGQAIEEKFVKLLKAEGEDTSHMQGMIMEWFTD